MNQTPLMAAAAAGNVSLVEALLERGANRNAVDHYGYNSLHWSLREAFRDPKFARGPFASLYELLAPADIDVNTGDRLVRIDRHLSEYLPFQTMWVLFKSRFTHQQRNTTCAFETQAILDVWKNLPVNVLRPERNKRQHLSAVLARNEIERDYAYNRALFKRVAQGWYQFNPKLAVRCRTGDDEQWVSVCAALNLPMIHEFAYADSRGHVSVVINRYLRLAGLPACTTAIAAERDERYQEAARRVEQERIAAAEAAAEAKQFAEARVAIVQPTVKWGTKDAKKMEVERLRREIEARKHR